MKVEKLVEIIGSDFYTGVPDSQLKALCNYLINTYGIDKIREQEMNLIEIFYKKILGAIKTAYIHCNMFDNHFSLHFSSTIVTPFSPSP